MKIRNVFIDTIIRIVLSDIHVAEDYLRIWGTVAHLCQGPMRLPARPRATFEASPLLAGSPLLGGCGVSDAGSGHLINSCGRARDFSPVLVFFRALKKYGSITKSMGTQSFASPSLRLGLPTINEPLVKVGSIN